MDAVQNVVQLGASGTAIAAHSRPTPGISLVLPAYNEQAIIQQAIREADEGLATLTDDYEILVVDDGSTDSTRQLAEEEALRRSPVRVISLPQNQGYGAALRAGFQAASKPWIGFTDSDCQFDVRELDHLALLLHKHDIACGYRIDRQDSWLRCFYSKVYNGLVGTLLGTGVRDCDCALKLFRREVLESLSMETDGFLINAELLTRARLAGKSVVEVGVTHRVRGGGTSTVSVWHTIPVIKALVRFWWSTILFPGTRAKDAPEAGSWGRGRTGAAVLSLSLLALLMLFWNLSYPLIEPDESRYAQIALEMVQTGDYLVPRLHGEAYMDKPPLLYWATAAGFRLFGPRELAARLPSAIAAMLTALATFLLGRSLVGNRVAYLASIMLFLCLGFVLSGRFLIMDGMLTLFTTVGILASLLAIRATHLRWGWWLLGAAACALGILTKGPVAAVLVIPPLIVMQWITRGVGRPRLGHWLLFATVVAAIALPWFALATLEQPGFASQFLWKHHVLRFVHAFNHQEPVWYYIPVLLIGMFPSSLLFSPLAIFLMSRSESLRRQRTPELGGIVLGALWIVVFFSMSRCKLPTYILPAAPLLCLVQAGAFVALLDKACPIAYFRMLAEHLPIWTTGLALITGLAISCIDLWMRPDYGLALFLNISVIAIAAAFFIALLLRGSWWPRQPASWAVATVVSLTIMAFGFQKFMPDLALHRSINANAAQLHASLGGGALPVVYYDQRGDAASFYLDSRHIRHFSPQQLADLKQFLARHPQVVLVADPSRARQLREKFGAAIKLTETHRGRGRLFVLTSHLDPLLTARPRTGEMRQ